MKTVYTCFCTDIIHAGHLNIIRQARKYGRVVVGALSDAALIKYNRFPTISIEERIKLYEEIDGVNEVVVQDNIMYNDIIEKLHPDYVLHGDNWREGPEAAIRENVLKCIATYGGELIEIGYTYNSEVKKIDKQLREKLAMPEYRRKRLRQLLSIQKMKEVCNGHIIGNWNFGFGNY